LNRSRDVATVGLTPAPRQYGKTGIFVTFVVFGIFLGSWTVSLSQLKQDLGLSAGELGATLTTAALVALPFQFLAGGALRRWGRAVFPAACLALAGAIIALTLVHSRPPLFAVLPLVSISAGFFNICINAAALHHEHQTGDRIMPTMHAGFSVGGVPGTLMLGALIAIGAGLSTLYLLVAAILIVTATTLSRLTIGLRVDPEAGGRLVLDPELVRNRAFLMVVALGMVGSIGESSMYTWTAIYLRDRMHAGALIGGTGVAAFYAAMAVGRFGSSVVQRRLKRLGTLSLAGALIAVGMSIALATDVVWIAIAGVLVTGIAYAVSAPTAFSVAGSLAPGKPAAISSFIWPMNAIAILTIPLLIGSLADATSLRFALSSQILIGLVILTGSTLFRRSTLSAGVTD
jgi:MFS family permease